MRNAIRTIFCGALLGSLAVACTIQQTNQLPESEPAADVVAHDAAVPSSDSSITPPEDASFGDAQPVVATPPDAAATVVVVTSVTGFTLINADNDQPIANYDPIKEGATLTLAALPSQNLNIRANTTVATGEAIGSVAFDLDGVANVHVEGAAPYALGSDNAGDFPPLTPPLTAGAHTLTARTYAAAAAAGASGPAKSLNFIVQ